MITIMCQEVQLTQMITLLYTRDMGKQKSDKQHNLNFRNTPIELIQQLKVAAAIHHSTLKDYCLGLLQHHVEDLKREGVLLKGKKP